MPVKGTSIGPAGKYRYLLDLGSGGMAKVWLALRSGPAGFRKLMVVKELREHIAEQPAFRNMFLEEARLAARLQHPNIVQTVEVGEDDGRYFLVMEYLDGQSLQAVIERKPLPVPMAISVLCDALSGLHAAHEWKDFDETVLSVVHRDVSPHNILLTYDGQVKVVDFGIAKTVNSGSNLTQQGTFRGKVSYVAPEQAAGETVDRRADVFAAGVVLFELLTGRRMWGDLPDVAILHRLTSGQIPAPRSVARELPPALERICMRALARDPRERYATAAELKDDLEAYLASTGLRTGLAELGPHMKALFAEDRKRTRDLIQRRLNESSAPPAPKPSASIVPKAPPPLPYALKATTKSGAPSRPVPPPSKPAAAAAPRPNLRLPDTRPMPRAPIAPASRTPSSKAPGRADASLLPAPYRTTTLMHRGERAEVHEALHVGLERRVVAKILRDATDEAGLLRQARALASFCHPYAARVLDAGMRGAEGEGAFLVREYVDGTPLSALLSASGRLGAARTMRLGAQLLSALAGAHARGLVHAQLRPEHLIVVRNGVDRERLVVIDFVGVEGGPIASCPGRHHLSPELARGEPPTASSDIYAAGVVLYQCLAGAPPFDAPDDVTLFYRAAHEPPPFIGAPAFELEATRAFFERALSKRPEARFESAKEMLRSLLALPFAELAELADERGADAMPFDSLAEPWLATGAGSATGTHTGLRARTHVPLAEKEPTLWVLTGDPAIRGPIVGEALEALRHEMDVIFLDEAERETAIANLEAGRVDLPWVVLFGDLHVLLGEPLLARLGACGEISRVLVSTHANIELLQSTINACGLDQQVCMPFEPAALIAALREMAKRSAALHRHYDRLRLQLRDARERATALSRVIAAVPLSPEGFTRS